MSATPYVAGVAAGLSQGGLYALVAFGYNLVYQSSRIFNFAQGDLLTLGGLFAFTLITSHAWTPLIAVVPVVLAVGIVGFLQERITIAPLMRRRNNNSVSWLVTTLGASIVIENIAQITYGSNPLPVRQIVTGPPFHVFGAAISRGELLIIGVSVALAVVLEVTSRRTMIGRAWRAIAEDPLAASARGVPVRRVGTSAFVLAAAISGLGGFIAAPTTSAVYDAGALLSINGFVAIALGGFGSQFGALVGAFLLGITQQEAGLLINAGYQEVFSLAVLLLVLLLRPRGIFGPKLERSV
jgi:branched-chain amino acid transport system permease protein